MKITARFRDTEHLLFEDTKRIISPEKFRDFRETGPWLRGLSSSVHLYREVSLLLSGMSGNLCCAVSVFKILLASFLRSISKRL